jgi:hypothetical protein
LILPVDRRLAVDRPWPALLGTLPTEVVTRSGSLPESEPVTNSPPRSVHWSFTPPRGSMHDHRKGFCDSQRATGFAKISFPARRLLDDQVSGGR